MAEVNITDLPSSQWVTQPEDKSWENVLHLGVEKIWKRKSIIFKPSDSITDIGIMLVRSGAIQLLALGPRGHSRTLFFVGKGGILGDTSYSCGQQYLQHYATALQDCTAIHFKTDVVWDSLIPQYPNIAKSLLRNAAIKYCITSTQLEDSSFRPAEQRLARFLYQYTLVDPKGLLELSQNTVADLLGLHRVTVCRIINEFKRDGFLDNQKKGVLVTSLKMLEKLI